MSNLSPTFEVELCVSEPDSKPTLQVLPGRLTDLGGLPIRRLLPRSQRRMVGPWCFLDSYGPVNFSSGKPMDVPPHPHIGLQTVSWLLEGDLLHKDSLGLEGPAGPGVLNLMTAGRGIAHAEETSTENGGHLRGVQLWVALPNEARETAPSFEQHRSLQVVELEGGGATLIMGHLDGVRSPARTFSPLVAADLSGAAYGARRPTALDRHPLLPGLRTPGAGALLRSRSGAGTAPGRRAIWRDDSDVVELRGADY